MKENEKMQAEAQPTIRQLVMKVRRALKEYFGHTKVNVYFEENKGKYYVFITYVDFKPLCEVEPAVMKCVKLAKGQITFAELSRKFSDTVLKEKLFQMYKSKRITIVNNECFGITPIINKELANITF